MAEVEAHMDQRLLAHPQRPSLHLNTNVAIELDGITGGPTSDDVMLTRQGDGPWQVFDAGRCVDRLVWQAAARAWRFAERGLVR
jgi:hypothetical protein